MKESIIQFGVGVFLRGFADDFIDRLQTQGLFEGSIVVVQPRAGGRVQLINEQNGLYNLVLRSIKNGEIVTEKRVIHSLSRGIDPYTDFEAYLHLAENPDFRIVLSNTTENGIVFDETCRFEDKPALSFPGKLTQLLFRRFECGLSGFLLLPCELIDNNGDALRDCVLSYAKLWNLGEDFLSWVKNENRFANTLVDRIVTGFPAEEAETLAPGDKLLNTGEHFHFWAIEGNFEDELPLQKGGIHALWADDITPYKRRKIRMLNGAHTSMVPGALLCGMDTVCDCMNDTVVSAFLRKCLFEEIVPALGAIEDALQFANDTLERFRNPFIKHRLRAIAMNSVGKFKVRVLPSMLDYHELNGKVPPALSLSLAFLLHFYRFDTPEEAPATIDFIRNNSTQTILQNKDFWGCDLTFLIPAVTDAEQKIAACGAKGAMEWILS